MPRATSSDQPPGFNRHPCALCQEVQYRQLFRLANIPIVQCVRCGHVYSLLQLEKLLDVYDQQYYLGVRRDQRRVVFSLPGECRQETERMTFMRRLSAIQTRLGRKGRILDVGCGEGEFLAVAQRNGWQVEGIEPSAYASRFARETYQIQVHTGTLNEVSLCANSYDVVTLFDVIEHVPQPKHLLRQVARILKPGGLLYITTPNIASLSARILGKHWYHLKPLEHLHYFSPKTIAQAMVDCRFERLGTRPALDVVTIPYVLDRLRAYNEDLFRWLLSVSLHIGAIRVPIAVPLGEIEAWGWKGKTSDTLTEASEAPNAD